MTERSASVWRKHSEHQYLLSPSSISTSSSEFTIQHWFLSDNKQEYRFSRRWRPLTDSSDNSALTPLTGRQEGHPAYKSRFPNRGAVAILDLGEAWVLTPGALALPCTAFGFCVPLLPWESGVLPPEIFFFEILSVKSCDLVHISCCNSQSNSTSYQVKQHFKTALVVAV